MLKLPYWRIRHLTETFLLLGSPGLEALPDTPRRHKSAAEPHRCQIPAREPAQAEIQLTSGSQREPPPGQRQNCSSRLSRSSLHPSESTTCSWGRGRTQTLRPRECQNTRGKEKDRSPLAANAAPWPDSPRSHPATCPHERSSWTAPTRPLCHPPASPCSTTWTRRNQSPALLRCCSNTRTQERFCRQGTVKQRALCNTVLRLKVNGAASAASSLPPQPAPHHSSRAGLSLSSAASYTLCSTIT